MTKTKHILAAFALVAASSTALVAQGSDFGSPLGAGAGVVGSVTSLGRGPVARPFTSIPVSPRGIGAFGAFRSTLTSASGRTLIISTRGGNAPLPANVAQALGAVAGGAPTPTQLSTYTGALTGVPAGAASALATALQTLGANPTFANVVAATNAYNAAVDGLPAGAPMPPALAATRFALFQAARN